MLTSVALFWSLIGLMTATAVGVAVLPWMRQPSPPTGRSVPWLLAGLLPVTAFLLYTQLGTGTLLFAAPPLVSERQMPSVEQMVVMVKEYLAAHPDDAQALLLLDKLHKMNEASEQAAQSTEPAKTN